MVFIKITSSTDWAGSTVSSTVNVDISGSVVNSKMDITSRPGDLMVALDPAVAAARFYNSGDMSWISPVYKLGPVVSWSGALGYNVTQPYPGIRAWGSYFKWSNNKGSTWSGWDTYTNMYASSTSKGGDVWVQIKIDADPSDNRYSYIFNDISLSWDDSVDRGLRIRENGVIKSVGVTNDPSGASLRARISGVTRGVSLVDTNDPRALKTRIRVGGSTKSLMEHTP